jgi:hypothetical protein
MMEQEGYKVTYLPVQPNGIIDLDQLRDAITPETSLVSVMAVNNEIGVIQPLKVRFILFSSETKSPSFVT